MVEQHWFLCRACGQLSLDWTMNNSLLLCVTVAVVWCLYHEVRAADIVIRPNLLTANCPHGQVYMTACKKCFCKENVEGSPHWPWPYCRKDKCDEAWACPDPPIFTRKCEGRCMCNATTAVTTCDKYCEQQLQATQGKPVVIEHHRQDKPVAIEHQNQDSPFVIKHHNQDSPFVIEHHIPQEQELDFDLFSLWSTL